MTKRFALSLLVGIALCGGAHAAQPAGDMDGANTPQGKVALEWRKLVLDGKVREAFEKYSTPVYITHGLDSVGRPGFASDAERNITMMEQLLTKQKIEETIMKVSVIGDLVLVHSMMTLNGNKVLQVTMQRVENGRIVEHWPWGLLSQELLQKVVQKIEVSK